MSGDRHVPAAGGDQDLVGQNEITLGRFLDRQGAGAIEPLREDPGELGGHVLHDQDRRHAARSECGRTWLSACGPPVEMPITRQAVSRCGD